jgi:hypothetical protein
LRAWRETQRDSRQYGLKTISSSHEKQ